MAWAAALNRMTTVVRDTFPAAVVYDPDGAALALVGVFDEAQEMIAVSEDGAEVSTVRSVLELRLADLGITPKSRDEVTVAEAQAAGGYGTAVRYRVTSVQPDGSGNTVLVLTKVSS